MERDWLGEVLRVVEEFVQLETGLWRRGRSSSFLSCFPVCVGLRSSSFSFFDFPRRNIDRFCTPIHVVQFLCDEGGKGEEKDERVNWAEI